MRRPYLSQRELRDSAGIMPSGVGFIADTSMNREERGGQVCRSRQHNWQDSVAGIRGCWPDGFRPLSRSLRTNF